MGSVMFNSAYSVAIDVLRWRLAQASLMLCVHVPHDAFWAPSAPDEECTDAVDVTFVDDECVALVASSPSKLRAAIDILLNTIFSVFGACHLQISWEPGKTEGIDRRPLSWAWLAINLTAPSASASPPSAATRRFTSSTPTITWAPM